MFCLDSPSWENSYQFPKDVPGTLMIMQSALDVSLSINLLSIFFVIVALVKMFGIKSLTLIDFDFYQSSLVNIGCLKIFIPLPNLTISLGIFSFCLFFRLFGLVGIEKFLTMQVKMINR